MRLNPTTSTVTFFSRPDFYEKEKTGIKPNTIRWLTSVELVEVLNAKPAHIEIFNTDEQVFFSRELTDISTYNGVTIFSWMHEVDEC